MKKKEGIYTISIQLSHVPHEWRLEYGNEVTTYPVPHVFLSP